MIPQEKEKEIVTITLTREQAAHLSHVLHTVHTHGVHDFDGIRMLKTGNWRQGKSVEPTPLFRNDERLRAAFRILRKLEDCRRKGIDLSSFDSNF